MYQFIKKGKQEKLALFSAKIENLDNNELTVVHDVICNGRRTLSAHSPDTYRDLKNNHFLLLAEMNTRGMDVDERWKNPLFLGCNTDGIPVEMSAKTYVETKNPPYNQRGIEQLCAGLTG